MKLTASIERYALSQPFVIARGAVDAVDVVVVELEADGVRGRGEATPLAFMGESPQDDVHQLRSLQARLPAGLQPRQLPDLLPPGSARNALDCALWDLIAKLEQRSIWELLDVPLPAEPLAGVMTISIGTPARMAAEAQRLADCPLLKIKLDAAQVEPRMRAIREAVPAARLTVDANESWSFAALQAHAPLLAELGVEMLEQPLARGQDAELLAYTAPLPLAADESCRTAEDLDWLEGRYELINIKLDKTGGLSAALDLARSGRARGLRLMTGCNLGTSLAMAPGFVLASLSEYRDLDGPTMLKQDRAAGMRFEQGWIHPFGPDLWG